MSYARIPDFSQPVPVRRPAAGHAPHRRTPVDGRYLNLPNEPLPGEDDLWEITEPVRAETPHSRGLRVLDVAGELLTAVLIIAGGVAAYGWLLIA